MLLTTQQPPLHGVVLLVENDQNTRRIARHVLSDLGLYYFQAADGNEAMSLARNAGTIDLLVADLLLPHMGGWLLANALREMQPDLKVLYITGSPHELAQLFVPEGAAFIVKPFLPPTFEAKVREQFSRTPATGER